MARTRSKKQSEVKRAIETIREFILEGKLRDIQKFPSESKLAEDLGMSRLTVREALIVLENEGYITRRQGSSTVVTTFARKLTGKIDKAGELGSLITDTGHKLKVDNISWSWETSTKEQAEALNISEGEELLVVKKRFLADTTPAAYCVNRIPRSYLEGVEFSVQDLAEHIFTFIEEQCDLNFSHDFMEVVPSITDENLSDVLDLEYHTPLLRFDITKHTIQGDAIMYNTDYYVHDLIKFTASRTISHS
ncbi:GntR family transcriptional regulator [Lentibacillus salinarum]|uniref:GntR family transcriptional regulator n=1 Tax=Lentibacillus salinarum TaxID=446820 RepID=A0ABW3ZP23_9BACI